MGTWKEARNKIRKSIMQDAEHVFDNYTVKIFRDEDGFVATTIEDPTILGVGDGPHSALESLECALHYILSEEHVNA